MMSFVDYDVQGLELEVIKGFGNKLNRVKYIFSEITILYKNTALGRYR